MLAAKRVAGVTPEVNLRNPLCAGKKAHKQGIQPGFETQGRCHQKSKIGISVAPQTGLLSSKILKSPLNLPISLFSSQQLILTYDIRLSLSETVA